MIGGSLYKPLELADNYFFVGGNSLNAVIVVTKLKDQGFQLGKGMKTLVKKKTAINNLFVDR